jgi:putative acetyltransferase
MKIKIDHLESVQIAELLQAHHQDMLQHSPETSVHALDVTALKAPEVTFWSAWFNNDLAGCGALKELSPDHVELKSMRTSEQHLRKGVAAKLLSYLLVEAKARGYKKMSLETGTATAFIPAQKLYKRFGFVSCAPFSDYQEDPYSLFLTKILA